MAQVENTKPKGPKNPKLMLVSYGRMGQLGWFEHNEANLPKLNSKVIIKTDRGLELGELVGIHNYRGGQFRSSPDQVESYYGNLGSNSPVGPGGQFVRFATHEDIREQEHLVISEKEEIECCEKYIKQFNLPMRIVEAEHLFGGERIVYYFTSEGRVDFRELVKTLAREYQTRIELRQIGARDEAKLVSDYETCGQQCCCSRYLKILEPVNMRMAKLQKATLDPSKISGHCGRLKCCLRYEDHTYMELKDKLPTRNSTVRTPKGTGRVVDVQILTQLVVVQDALGDRQAWPVDELLPLNATPEEVEALQQARRPKPDDDFIVREVEDEAQTEQDATLTPSGCAACQGECPGRGADPGAAPSAQPPRSEQQDRSRRRRPRNTNQNKPQNQDKPAAETPAGEGQAAASRSSRRNKNRRKKRRGGGNKPDGGPNTPRPNDA